MPRKPPPTDEAPVPSTRTMLVWLFMSSVYFEAANACQVWKTCKRGACRRRKSCAIDLFEVEPPPCVQTWDGETIRASHLIYAGMLHGIMLGQCLWDWPERERKCADILPEGYTLEEIAAGMPWADEE